MEALSQQRCLQHPAREAVARCPRCRQFFCRECVTEHEARIICAACLRRQLARATASRHRGAAWLRAAGCAAGFLVAWLFFYGMGRLLLKIPSSFHDGTAWRRVAPDQE
jgi:hypothetical protein